MAIKKRYLVSWTPTCDGCGIEQLEEDEYLCSRCKGIPKNHIRCKLVDLYVIETDTSFSPPQIKQIPATNDILGRSDVILNIANGVGGSFSLRLERINRGFYCYQVINPGFEEIGYCIAKQ